MQAEWRRRAVPGAIAILITSSGMLAAPPEPITDPTQRLENYQRHEAMRAETPFDNMPWQFLGPTNISGRVTDVAVAVPRGEHYTMYAATASGGVWKTVNDGITWEPIFEDVPSTSIGDITLAPSDNNVVWVGTGEANIFRSSMAGCGVYKSTDGGETWEHKGLGATQTIPRILIHPTNPDIVYVASSGNEWTDNEERGVYKSTDGGDSWEKVLYISPRTGAIDLVMDPSDPDTLYASTWQRIRRRWNDPRIEDGYNESGIYKTTDGGANWNRLTEGLPIPEVTGRVGIDLCATQPNVVYAFIDNYTAAEAQPQEGETDSYGRPSSGAIKGAQVYRSDDGGATWRMTSQDDRYMRGLCATYGWVFGQMRVDPNNPDTIYVMGLALNRSDDSGHTFRRLGRMHGDHHALWIDPENSDFLVNGNDGGICMSYDGGVRWREFLDNLPAVQFYNVGFDYAEPFNVYGSIQDHGSRKGAVDLSRGRDRIRATDWVGAPGGEASTHQIDPDDPNIVYSAGFYGSISRTNIGTGDRHRPQLPRVEGELPLRGQWLAPFIISPHDNNVIYHGMNKLFKSTDRAETFTAISPDLSRGKESEIGDIPYQTIFSISESPLERGLIYVGTDDGLLHVTRDDGESWNNINGDLAKDRTISRIEASRYDAGTVYVAQNGKRWDDFQAYLFRSRDYGSTWEDIAGNLPGGPVNVVREDPRRPNILYAGTDVGVYVSIDSGASWHVLGGNLPSTFVHDIAIHPRDKIAVIATHGRGMYALDLEPLYVISFFGGKSQSE